jgi:hypothetical protein
MGMLCPSTLMVSRGTLGNELAKWNPEVLGEKLGTTLIVAMSGFSFSCWCGSEQDRESG